MGSPRGPCGSKVQPGFAQIPRSIPNLPAHGCQIKDDGSVATGRTAIGTKEIKGIQIEIIQMSVQ